MSARNSHAAKAARRVARSSAAAAAGMPPSHARIAEAVHRAVCNVTGGGGFGHCALYARAGALVASCAMGRKDAYVINAGRMSVFTGVTDDDGAERHLMMDPAMAGQPGAVAWGVPGAQGSEFHAWFVRRPEDLQPGTLQATPGDAEIIDLGMRHYPAMAEVVGLDWQREPLPRWYWGPFSGLAPLRVVLSADAEMTYRVIREQPLDPVFKVTDLAVQRLGLSRSQLLAALS